MQVSCLSYCYLVDYNSNNNKDNDEDDDKVSNNDSNVKTMDVEVIITGKP